jgi:uncharacterized membrane protein YbhN (UPF0104 family)
VEEEVQPARSARLWLRSLLGLCMGLLAVWIFTRFAHITREQFLESIRDLTPGPLLLAIPGGLILMAIQAFRWWIVMRPVVPLRYTQAYRALMVGFAFNVLLPARGGDLLRVQYLGKRTGVSRAKILGTEIVDFWSDKWGWVASFPIVCLIEKPPQELYVGLLMFGSLVVGVAVLLGLMGSRAFRSSKTPAWLLSLRDGFAANDWKRLLLVETVIAPLPWLWESLVIQIAGHAFGFDLTFMHAYVVLAAFNLATIVPSPGNAGSFETGGAGALTYFCHVPQATALAFIFLYHLTQVIPGLVGGVLILALEGETLFGKGSIVTESAAVPPVSTAELGAGLARKSPETLSSE